MDARLAKIRERKQLKQSAVEEGEKAGSAKGEKEGGGEGTEGEMVDPIAAMIESELGRAREKAEKTGEGGGEGEEDTGRKKKPYVRPWDKGKGGYDISLRCTVTVLCQTITCLGYTLYMYMYMCVFHGF